MAAAATEAVAAAGAATAAVVAATAAATVTRHRLLLATGIHRLLMTFIILVTETIHPSPLIILRLPTIIHLHTIITLPLTL